MPENHASKKTYLFFPLLISLLLGLLVYGVILSTSNKNNTTSKKLTSEQTQQIPPTRINMAYSHKFIKLNPIWRSPEENMQIIQGYINVFKKEHPDAIINFRNSFMFKQGTSKEALYEIDISYKKEQDTYNGNFLNGARD
jgi:hypothetical protein